MFDIGFWEIAVIAVVALLVVGPNELPSLLRTVGAMVRKVRRFIREAKADLDQEIRKVDDLKRLMSKEAEIAELHENMDPAKPTVPVKRSSRDSTDTTGQESAAENTTSDRTADTSDKPPHGTPE
jgi:sec-independent protein translocase protein TatB